MRPIGRPDGGLLAIL